ncbi:DUF2490 domain-containing protein [Nannocystis sp. RBIL2]|uniref:DUF2490 domain-containing protein n=1 Tax=Nannocystis sp. RBIL2 TaxID=2996788 RepID=UPI00227139DA|nr:DUF2490 domain-containing protein [Nannocystis sp. RBIL2]MCY1064487.1 DUF2490 domain-containing protein [Nannocystis sp. RBIL2]
MIRRRRFVSSRSLQVAAGLAAALVGGPARAAAPPEPDLEMWSQVLIDANLDARAKGLRLSLDLQLRRMNAPLQYIKDMSGTVTETRQNPNTVAIVRPAIGYMWAKWGGLFLGYAWQPDFFDDRAVARVKNVDEHRIYTQFNLRWQREGRFDLGGRSRLEHRIRSHGPGSDDIVDGEPQHKGLSRWAHRFRQQVRFAVNFKKDAPWQLIVWDEFFFHLNETAFTTERGFDQNRAFVGIGYDTKPVRVEVGYINQYVRRFHDPDQLNHVFALNFIIKLGHAKHDKHAPAPPAPVQPPPNH